MKPLVIYLLEVLACSGILLAAYAILLERRVCFRWCRTYLLFATAVAGVIPLLRIPVWAGETIEIPALPAITEWSEVVAPPPVEPGITPTTICLAIYLLGTALIITTMLWQVLRIGALRRNATVTDMGRYRLVLTRKKVASFSFFRSVYIWQGTSSDQLPAILMHEASHIAHHHSTERVAMECLKAALWWNPFVWIAARRLTEAEEFEADNDVLQSGYDLQTYMDTIFKQLFGYSPEIANGLRDSLTKKRFQMMTTKTHGRYALLRLAGTIPALLGLLCAFGFTSRAAVIVTTPPAEETAASSQILQVMAADQSDSNTVGGGNSLRAAIGSDTATVIDIRRTDEDSLKVDPSRKALTTPMYIVDGKPVDNIESIKPEDISSISVLKNKESLKKYGERAANGVVEIVTKRAEYNQLLKAEKGQNADNIYLIDGTVHNNLKSTPADSIAKIEILPSTITKEKYGDRKVVSVTTKGHARRIQETMTVYPNKQTSYTAKEDQVFLVTEVMPKFKGGDLSTFRKWVQEQVVFPEQAHKAGISGRVVVSFVIERDGAINDISVLQTPDKSLSAEAIRVLGATPPDSWTPGMQNDKIVRVRFTLPIDFSQLPAEK